MSNTTQIKTGFAEVNGTQLYYEVAGEGHPLVLSHGFLADKSSWDDQFQFLAQHYKVIRYNLRGFGSSGLINAPYSQVEDLYALLKFLNIEKTYLLGLSGSGSIVIDLTLEHPEMVDALIAVAAGVSGYHSPLEDSEEQPAEWQDFLESMRKGDISGAAEAMLRFWIDGSKRPPSQVDPVIRGRVRDMLIHNYSLPNNPNAWNLAQPSETPAINRLSEIHVPTLVIYGDKDEDDTIAVADILSSQIKGAKKVVIPNTTHHPNMEKPSEFNHAVLNFLSALPTREA
jgi:3-oxoadipate enol-lactonase